MMAKKRNAKKAAAVAVTAVTAAAAGERPARFEARTPNRKFAGSRAGVMFFQGIGYTDDPAKAAELRKLGYLVTE